MEVGSLRERIVVALLIYKFGEASVETQIPITEPEVDVKLFFDRIGKERYIKLPKQGTNPRGVEITSCRCGAYHQR